MTLEDEQLDLAAMLLAVRSQAAAGKYRLTRHSVEEMTSRNISLEEVLRAIACGEILENYPNHQRGACCLLCDVSNVNRPLHIVCTSGQPELIIITAYQPELPKWASPICEIASLRPRKVFWEFTR